MNRFKQKIYNDLVPDFILFKYPKNLTEEHMQKIGHAYMRFIPLAERASARRLARGAKRIK